MSASDVGSQLWHGYDPSLSNGGHGGGLPFPGFDNSNGQDGHDEIFKPQPPNVGPTHPIGEGNNDNDDDYDDIDHGDYDDDKGGDYNDDHEWKPPVQNPDDKCKKWDWWGDQAAISVNLGNWLIPEWSWMGHPEGITYNGDIYSQCMGRTQGCTDEMELNWNTYIEEKDIEYISNHGANMVRIPVPYWAFISTNENEPYPESQLQKDNLERVLNVLPKYDLHAVVDIHSIPGSQNGLEHSGKLGEAYFLTQTSQYWERSLETVKAVTEFINTLPDDTRCKIAGIENANEIKPENEDQIGTTKKFAVESRKIVNEGGYTLVTSDAFLGPAKWTDVFTNGENVVLDVHRYWAYDEPNEVSDQSIADDLAKFATEISKFHLPVCKSSFSKTQSLLT